MDNQGIDKQLSEMEEQLSHLISAIEALENAKKTTRATSSALKKAQVNYTDSTKEAISALDSYSASLTEKGSDLLSANEELIKEVGNLNLGEVAASIKGVDKRVKEALQPQLRQMASSKQLEEAFEMQRSRIDAALKQMTALDEQLNQLHAETKLIKAFAIAAVGTGLVATILSAIGLIL